MFYICTWLTTLSYLIIYSWLVELIISSKFFSWVELIRWRNSTQLNSFDTLFAIKFTRSIATLLLWASWPSQTSTCVAFLKISPIFATWTPLLAKSFWLMQTRLIRKTGQVNSSLGKTSVPALATPLYCKIISEKRGC